MVSIFQNYEIFRYTGKISIKISGILEKLVLKFPVDGFGQRICLATGMERSVWCKLMSSPTTGVVECIVFCAVRFCWGYFAAC